MDHQDLRDLDLRKAIAERWPSIPDVEPEPPRSPQWKQEQHVREWIRKRRRKGGEDPASQAN